LAVLAKKVAHRGLRLRAMSDFLPSDTRELKRYWENDLQQQVNPLPPLDEVLKELQGMLDESVAPHLHLTGI